MKRKRVGEILRVKENHDDAGSGFIDLAGTVAVPPEKKSTSWKAIKAAT